MAARGAGTRALLAALWLAGAPTLAAPSEDAPRGDPARGAALAMNRTQGLCVLCHALPGVPAAQAGTIGPALAGVGSRLDREALRARLVDPARFNPDTVMPAYRRTDGLTQVATARRGQALFSDAQVEDVVAWLETLR